VTLATIEVPIADANRFGIIAIDESRARDRVSGEAEHATAIPGSPDFALASMGVYIFDTDVLVRALEADANQPTNHDFGKDIIPALIHDVPVYAYRFYDENKKSSKYWRDIGTLDAYFEANMDLCQVNPEFNLYDPEWPLRNLPAAGAAGEVRVRRGRQPLRAGARLGDLARLHRLGQPDYRQRAVPERPGPQLLPDRRVHPDAGRPRRTPCAHQARDHRPGRADSARRARSATTRKKIAAATPSPTPASSSSRWMTSRTSGRSAKRRFVSKRTSIAGAGRKVKS
jgi:hypothetical protein